MSTSQLLNTTDGGDDDDIDDDSLAAVVDPITLLALALVGMVVVVAVSGIW
jgi:hypothetical protein